MNYAPSVRATMGRMTFGRPAPMQQPRMVMLDMITTSLQKKILSSYGLPRCLSSLPEQKPKASRFLWKFALAGWPKIVYNKRSKGSVARMGLRCLFRFGRERK